MKRKEIAEIIDQAGRIMDFVDEAFLKQIEEAGQARESVFCAISNVTEEEVRAMQTAMATCKQLLLEDSSAPRDPFGFVIKTLAIQGKAKAYDAEARQQAETTEPGGEVDAS